MKNVLIIGCGLLGSSLVRSISKKKIAKKIVLLSGKKIDIKFDTTKPEGDFDRMADNSKAEELLNWRPQISIDEGLKEVFMWCKKKLS